MAQAIEVTKKILLENQNNGELEGILNPWRVAALRKLIVLAERETGPSEFVGPFVVRRRN
jgi:hypothetical protein